MGGPCPRNEHNTIRGQIMVVIHTHTIDHFVLGQSWGRYEQFSINISTPLPADALIQTSCISYITTGLNRRRLPYDRRRPNILSRHYWLLQICDIERSISGELILQKSRGAAFSHDDSKMSVLKQGRSYQISFSLVGGCFSLDLELIRFFDRIQDARIKNCL